MSYRLKLLDNACNVFYSQPCATCEGAFYMARMYGITGTGIPCDIQTKNAEGNWFNLGIFNDGLDKPDY